MATKPAAQSEAQQADTSTNTTPARPRPLSRCDWAPSSMSLSPRT